MDDSNKTFGRPFQGLRLLKLLILDHGYLFSVGELHKSFFPQGHIKLISKDIYSVTEDSYFK